MVWEYDKQPANGSAFVYYGIKPVNAHDEIGKRLVEYSREVLDAIGIQNGPSHGEFIITPNGPCLVEMNCCAHGWNGIWVPLARALTGGYSQVDITAAAFLDSKRFKSIPDVPCYPFQASGQVINLVSHCEGEVELAPGYKVLELLPSYVLAKGLIKSGSKVNYTIDLIMAIGCVVFMHPDDETVKRDIAFIRYMEEINGFFTMTKDLDVFIESPSSSWEQTMNKPTVGTEKQKSQTLHAMDDDSTYLALCL